jgi:ureidoglycolate lyase
MIAIHAQPLTRAAFAPFGDVLIPDGADRRRYIDLATEAEPPMLPRLWVSQGAAVATLPVQVKLLERHPWSAQSFVPLTAARFLVVVGHAAADGSPDIATMRAFVSAGQGVSYRRNVWHHGMTALDPGAQFVVLMATAGHPDDDVFLDLATPFEVSGSI